MRNRIVGAVFAALLAGGTLLGPAAPASATGEYEYICQLTNGSSWSLASGESTTDCHGSFLQKYINGTMVANYNLVYDGGAQDFVPSGDGWCILALARTAAAALAAPGTGGSSLLLWVTGVAAASAGTLHECVG